MGLEGATGGFGPGRNGKGYGKRRHWAQNQEEIKVEEHTVFKFSKDISLAEEITLGDLGRNVFLQIIDGRPRISNSIDLSQKKHVIVKPHNQGTASPALPYPFKDVTEIEYFIEQAQKETVDSLFAKHKSVWKQIVVASDDRLIILLASDSVYSYFQDKFATTHYDMFVGGPGSGKGAILNGFRYLGYRVVLASDMSGANILDLLVQSNLTRSHLRKMNLVIYTRIQIN